jgi:hypothetical protein
MDTDLIERSWSCALPLIFLHFEKQGLKVVLDILFIVEAASELRLRIED